MRKRWGVVVITLILLMALMGCNRGSGVPPDWSTPVNGVIRADILVIGAGPAGLAAGNTLVREGKRVLIIEKNGIERVGGATLGSGGVFMAGGGSKLQASFGGAALGDTPQRLFEDLLATGLDNYPRLATLFANNNAPTADWLLDTLNLPFAPQGVGFIEHRHIRAVSLIGGPAKIGTSMLAAYENAGGRIRFNHKAEKLIVEDGAVVGALVLSREYGGMAIYADSVILVTGGFGNNKDILREYAPQLVNVLYYGPLDACHGDGLLMALAPDIRAHIHYMDRGKIVPHGIQTAPDFVVSSSLPSMFVTQNSGAIYVNSSGRRVINENTFLVELSFATMENDMLFILMDAATFEIWRDRLDTWMPKATIDAYIEATVGRPFTGFPIFARHDTIEGVAAIAGVPPANLRTTVNAFNAGVARGVDAFGRTRPNPLVPIGAGPYYLIEQKPRFATTLGGLHINNYMQVLRKTDGKLVPIPGLYAAGEIIGGVHGRDSLPSAGIAWALTSGRLAGLSTAGRRDQIVITPDFAVK